MPLSPLFPTLRMAGYLICTHPRQKAERCQDCGARKVRGLWDGVDLGYVREPYDC